MAVFYLCHEERCTSDALVYKGCIATHHLAHRHFAGSETQHRRGVLVYVGVVESKVVQDAHKLRWSQLIDEIG